MFRFCDLAAGVGLIVMTAGCVEVMNEGTPGVKPVSPLIRTSPPPKSRGTYAIWCSTGLFTNCLERGLVTGGQIMVQWGDIEKTEGNYDFSELSEKLKEFQALRKKYGCEVYTTVQINGNVKPDYLYQKVPHHKSYTHGRSDGKPVLMFWHPEYIKAHTNMIRAFANYLKKSPFRSCIMGIRQSYNAFGTEGYHIPGMRRDKRAPWITPKGVKIYDEIGLVDGKVVGRQSANFASPQTIELYKEIAVDAYLQNLSKDFLVFVRNTMPSDAIQGLLKKYGPGSFGLFHTSSHVEPLNSWSERNKWEKFLTFCRTGLVLGYTETWADAFGSAKWIPWCSPPQKNYWRILCDLHCGISFLSFYGADLGVACDGTYKWRNKAEECPAFQEEFFDAIMFARKYAGYHSCPKESPGAWIAFRDAPESSYQYNAPNDDKTLRLLNSDYSFLMGRIPGDDSIGIKKVGPDKQRYGAWARKLSKGTRIRLALDPTFAESINGKRVVLRVVYLDQNHAALKVACSGNSFRIDCRDTGKWQAARFPISHADFKRNVQNADIVVQCIRGAIVLHMIEVER